MEMVGIQFNDEDIKRLNDLRDFYGEEYSNSVITKAVLRKFHRELFSKDRSEEGQDTDLEQARGE